MINNRPLFSIITPVRNRPVEVERCILSVKNQNVNSEHIVINDWSTDNTLDVMKSLQYSKLVILQNESRSERAISIQAGIDRATGEWLMTMGSDDMLLPDALKTWEKIISENPLEKCFHAGWKVFTKDGRIIERHPAYINSKEEIRSGLVAAGSFIFHRSLLNWIPPFPHVMDCYALADHAGIPGYSRFTRTLGNPWGDDFFLFYWVSRYAVSKRIDHFMLGVYRR